MSAGGNDVDELDGGECPIEGGLRPLIPPGTYELRAVRWATRMLFNRQPKVVLTLKVCTFGEFFGTELERWYNVRSLKGPPRRSGLFSAGRSGDLLREYVEITGMPIRRRDRIAFSHYRGLLLEGEVETVKCDRLQRPLHPELRYSVVRSLSAAST